MNLNFVCCIKPYTIAAYLSVSSQKVERLLDLRAERCPMALLLAKRYVTTLTVGEEAEVILSDESSFQDVERYFRLKNHLVISEKIDDGFRLKVVIQN
ncbi:sulfurtransferase TusA family protein [Vibrio genomosp. F10]|uniref:sulfurtransferase TusA family protein n=1 Tax=Vibrio genomosp. F10 TaxID=723171 RepID=UPI001F525AC2|nr:sulfurtransferase TusA family protein [Vibrio genomosp. F10]